ncbi:MAG TPA: tRNA (N6-threonylcarbamoyladenosine(37)-N6)-methyltransferase TrmO [Dehalococcoidia bacterium]|nr:tRNA (N6-threonylcarbamoyladenosine(37)-N6)-methyltransferase TrmO [Dehalococcoidia bacterium]
MSILDRLRGLLPAAKPLVPREPVIYRPIGVVRNHVKSPRPHGWEDVRSDIFLRDDLVEAMEGLQDFSHVIVVFHFDKVPESERSLSLPVGNDGLERGVLASRSQRRPNGIGVAVVPIVHRRQGVLRVVGLDAIDGTPVLDLKPYLPGYDAVADAKLPAWAQVRSE